MLLRYGVFTLSILVSVSGRRTIPLVHGWQRQENGPHLGGIYWIDPEVLGAQSLLSRPIAAVPCVVLYRLPIENKYRVVMMLGRGQHALQQRPGRHCYGASEFFEDSAKLQTSMPQLTNLNNYYVFPHEKYEVVGNSKIIQARRGRLITIMSKDDLYRLTALSGMVDGWDARAQSGPQLGGVYWIDPQHLGFRSKLGVYMPVIIVNELQDKYRIRRMMSSIAARKAGKPGLQPASKFFKPGAKVQALAQMIDISSLHVILSENYVVKGGPAIMKKWESGDLTIMPKEGLERLDAALDGMVDGWDESIQREPKSGAIYWIRPRILGLTDTYDEKYIPCVVLHLVGHKYRVVRISRRPGQSAWNYFGEKATLQTGAAAITDLKNYYINPRENYEVEGDPKIMQRWEEGELTIMLPKHVDKLKKVIELLE